MAEPAIKSIAPDDPGPPPSRLGRILRPLGEISIADERVALLFKALIIALLFCLGKYALHRLGWEFVESIGLISSLIGGVIFTLAILLGATLQDYKESERLVGEYASVARRLHYEFAVIRNDPALLREVDDLLSKLTLALRSNLKLGVSIKLRPIHGLLAQLDNALARQLEGGRLPVARTAQVSLGTLTRILDRLEFIVETSFTRAGYAFAGAVTFAVIVALALTRLAPFPQAMVLFGLTSFLLVGLFLLIWDLDNPFSGHARVSTYQLDKVQAFFLNQTGLAP